MSTAALTVWAASRLVAVNNLERTSLSARSRERKVDYDVRCVALRGVFHDAACRHGDVEDGQKSCENFSFDTNEGVNYCSTSF